MSEVARTWTLADKVAFLSRAGHYPREPGGGAVASIETHFACVFLTQRHAYKMKKPVRQGSMDYRTLASRERGCRLELRLNRRLAPSVYLRVLPLTAVDGTLRIGRSGVVQDWLVVMRRLDAARMLDQVLGRRNLSPRELRRLSGRLSRFFARARPAPMGSRAYLARLRRHASADRRVLRRAGQTISQRRLSAVTLAQARFVRAWRAQLGARGARVIEGHGDLRAEHIHLGRPLCVIDCLEFSRELRETDPADELAFLAMETDRLGRARLGAALLNRYRRALRDPVAGPLVSFYKSRRALTRAKLCIWHVGEPQYPNARPWLRRAGTYLRDAERYIRDALEEAV
jgi:aminoglycoside phosphotransferase family enzyme